ncbi:hypothetical protein ACLB2K_029072 [Fragaria x ananassa]
MTPIYEPMSSSPSILASSSMSNYYPRVQYLPPTNGSGQLYFQSLYPHFQKQASQPPFQYRRHPLLLPRPQPNPVSRDQGGIESKAARDERRMARQRRVFSSRSAAESVSSSSPTQMDLCGADSDCQNTDLCTRTPDMKELKKLFKKELKKSDVGCWGRIVIPKKEAEKYLPSLVEKQGIMLWIRDVHSSHVWGMKYKYWANNKSRMYVFESAGSFIKTNRLEVGDCISLYEDDGKNFYFSIDKAGTKPIHVAESSHEQKHYATNSKDDDGDNNSNSITQITNSADNHKNTNSTTYTSYSRNTKLYTPYAFNEEDELYLAALLEDESDKVVTLTLSADPAFSQRRLEEANSSIDNVINSQSESSTQPAMAGIWAAPSSSQSIVKMVEEHLDENDDFLL